jgi:hypothetical protein
MPKMYKKTEFREDDVTTGADLYFLMNELHKCISMLGQTPGIVTDLGFLRGN